MPKIKREHTSNFEKYESCYTTPLILQDFTFCLSRCPLSFSRCHFLIQDLTFLKSCLLSTQCCDQSFPLAWISSSLQWVIFSQKIPLGWNSPSPLSMWGLRTFHLQVVDSLLNVATRSLKCTPHSMAWWSL